MSQSYDYQEKWLPGLILVTLLCLTALFISYLFGTLIPKVTVVFIIGGMAAGILSLILKCPIVSSRWAFAVFIIEAIIFLAKVDNQSRWLDSVLLSGFAVAGCYIGAVSVIFLRTPKEKQFSEG